MSPNARTARLAKRLTATFFTQTHPGLFSNFLLGRYVPCQTTCNVIRVASACCVAPHLLPSRCSLLLCRSCSTPHINMMVHASTPPGGGGWREQPSTGGSGGPLAFAVNSARAPHPGGRLRTSSSSSSSSSCSSSTSSSNHHLISSYRRPPRPQPDGVGGGLCSAGGGTAVLGSFSGEGGLRGEESGLRGRGKVRARGANGNGLCMTTVQEQRRQRRQRQSRQQLPPPPLPKGNKLPPPSMEVANGIVASISECEAGGGCGVGCCFVFRPTTSILCGITYKIDVHMLL